jgi:hypothetical protein
MKTEVFVEFFLTRLSEFLEQWKDIGVNGILRLPKWFNLQALYEKRGGVFPLNDLRTMISEVSEKASAEELEDFFHGLVAAIKFLDLSIDLDDKVSSVPKRREPKAAADQGAGKKDEGFPKSLKMHIMAEAFRNYLPGSEGETLRQALARSLMLFERKVWMEKMTEALKKAGEKKVKVSPADHGNFMVSAALRGLLKSRSRL